MILLAATSKSDRAGYALMFRQLVQTAHAIHEMHKATDDLRRRTTHTATCHRCTLARGAGRYIQIYSA